eukprot:COSAG01_NODE_5868_length_3981_cov_7.697321_2_plen_86_part_00
MPVQPASVQLLLGYCCLPCLLRAWLLGLRGPADPLAPLALHRRPQESDRTGRGHSRGDVGVHCDRAKAESILTFEANSHYRVGTA